MVRILAVAAGGAVGSVVLDKIVKHGPVTTEPVRVITYRSAEKPD